MYAMVPKPGGPVGRPYKGKQPAEASDQLRLLGHLKRSTRLDRLSVQAHIAVAGERAHHVSGKGRKEVTHRCDCEASVAAAD